ncbi:sensor histidine kinase [Desulfatitalea alkaliphila]|uniref:histidine kinase n=1 Tax=Desulfatitalea alkaliphila TaxID=2929485 RepID=A0AA41UK89_9BACT|nr:ATP-binding protein [Desulfatitalea alkaliphila]MCJ8500161.1 ATP-binding protein [Desulfatitalea alkaliphila]
MAQTEQTGPPGAHPSPSPSMAEGGYIYADDSVRKKYYRRLKRALTIGILLAYLIPITILTLYFNHKFSESVRESASLHLAAVTENQRNSIALYMQKRIVNVFNLFHPKDFNLTPIQDEMDYYLANLVRADAGFVDIGFINPDGIQIGYSGPYPHLLNKDYSQEDWYVALTTHPQSYIVTDLYLGLRRMPHFTIGVKQLIDGAYYVIRTSLDPDNLHAYLTTTSHGKRVDGFLINRAGQYQAVDADFGQLLSQAVFIPPMDRQSDVTEIAFNGQTMLLSYTWLKEVPWCLVMWQPRDVAFREMERIRVSMVTGSAILVFMLMVVIWLIVNRVIRWTEYVEHDRAELKTQLYHTHKLVAVGQLAGGVAHEINNPLAIIASEAGLIRDMLDERLGLECTPETIIKELDEIDKAVYRAKSITMKILSFVRRTDPKLVPCDIRQLLEDVVTGVKEQEFSVSNITVERDYDPNTPELMLDPDLMRQVFLNLINNASDAVGEGGSITLRTRMEDGWVRVSVADTGVGMDAEQVQKVFMPFFTTKEVGKGTGLGLSISQNIVEGFGGRIEVESRPGVGSVFTVVLPTSS